MEVLNPDDRIFKGYASVQERDKQGDIVPIPELEKAIMKLMDRGGTIIDSHTDRVVGKILTYQKTEKDGKPAIEIIGKIYNDYDLDDEVWKKIKTGEYKGLSIGGASQVKRAKVRGTPANILHNLELYELSVCDTPANSDAQITEYNQVAKSLDKTSIQKPFADFKDFDDCVKKVKEREHYDDETARKVCATIEHNATGKWPNEKSDIMENIIKEDELTEADFLKATDFLKAKYPWDQCIRDAMAEYHDKETAQRVCGAIRYGAVHHSLKGDNMKKQEETPEEKPAEQPEEKKPPAEEPKQDETAQALGEIKDMLTKIMEALSTNTQEEVTQAEKQDEGTKTTLPKSPQDEAEEPAEPDKEKVMQKDVKEIVKEEIKKQLSVVSTPRPEMNGEEHEPSALDIAHGKAKVDFRTGKISKLN